MFKYQVLLDVLKQIHLNKMELKDPEVITLPFYLIFGFDFDFLKADTVWSESEIRVKTSTKWKQKTGFTFCQTPACDPGMRR